MNAETFAKLNNSQLDAVADHNEKGQPLPIYATPYVWKDAKSPSGDFTLDCRVF